MKKREINARTRQIHMEQKAPTHAFFHREIKLFTLDEIPLGTITSHLHLLLPASVPQDT